MSLPIKNFKRILVVRYRFIGDTLMTVPFLRNLRRACPDAEIDVLVAPNSGEVLIGCPYLDNLIFYDTTRKHRYESAEGTSPRSFWSYVKELRERRYDTAFILKRSFSSAALAWLAGIPNRIGFDTEYRHWLLTQAIPYNRHRHEVDCFLDVLQESGVPVTDRHLEAWGSPAEEARVLTLFSSETKSSGHLHVMLHLTVSNPEKEWPEATFAQLAAWLIQEHGATLHCVGASVDHSRYHALVQALPDRQRSRFHNWCGRTSLRESLALIRKMDFVVGVDSGTLHMASAVGVPVVALFKVPNFDKWAPLGDNNLVVTDINLQKVQDACRQLMNPLIKTP